MFSLAPLCCESCSRMHSWTPFAPTRPSTRSGAWATLNESACGGSGSTSVPLNELARGGGRGAVRLSMPRSIRGSSREGEVAGDAVAVAEVAQGRFAGGVGAHRGTARRLVDRTAGREPTALPRPLEVEHAPGGGAVADGA